MRSPLISTLRKSILNLERWYQGTPERALEEAYQAAKAIKAIEDEHFDGQPIGFSSPYKGAVSTYFQTERDKSLRTIRVRLNEYKVGAAFVDLFPGKAEPPTLVERVVERSGGEDIDVDADTVTVETIASSVERQSLLDKLAFIDSVFINYSATRPPRSKPQSNAPAQRPKSSLIDPNAVDGKTRKSNGSKAKPESVPVLVSVQNSLYEGEFTSDDISADPSKLDSSSFIPRSILRTANRFRKELDSDPNTEEDILKDFRVSRTRTQGAVRFLLILAIMPLLVQSFMK
ncbi:MAG: proton extrusion protein PcxA, partial [Thermosynechococcaceae cyanobacterium]